MPRPATLSIVIPASDARATLAQAEAAVQATTRPGDEVLVIRNGAGPAALRNAGARQAKGDVLVFVDSDVHVHPDALDRVRAAFGADPELTALFGSYDDSPSSRASVSLFRNLLHHHVHQQSAGDATTFWAGLGAIRRDAFATAGGFDTSSYPTSMVEDIELGMRLSASGAKIVLDPRLRATHLKRWTLPNMVATDLTRRGMPWVRMLIRRRELPRTLNLGWRHRASAILYAAVAVLMAWRGRRLVAPLLVGVVALNREFYGLLFRRGGLRFAVAGVALHWIHHLVAVVSVPAGAARYAVESIRRSRP